MARFPTWEAVAALNLEQRQLLTGWCWRFSYTRVHSCTLGSWVVSSLALLPGVLQVRPFLLVILVGLCFLLPGSLFV